MNIYDCTAQEGNCYTGCAYMCFRKRLNNLAKYRLNKQGFIEKTEIKSDSRFANNFIPSDGYYVYCPKHPVDGFDIIENIDDEQNLLRGMFHVRFVLNKNVTCPCFDSKYDNNPFSRIQDHVSYYQEKM